MKKQVVKEIQALLGNQSIVIPESMAGYLKGNEAPLALVFPENTSDVVKIIKIADKCAVKVAVGGNTVVTKGLKDGIAISMARMSRIIEIDHENLVATVEPGVNHKEFQEKLAAEGLYFPPEPFKGLTSSIGGCFASGTLDSRSFNYGPTRTYILGFEMVLPNGEVLNVGSKTIKNVAGYDMIHFVVGSRGTLGIITKVLIKLLPLPAAQNTVLGSFLNYTEACKCIRTLFSRRIYTARLNLLNSAMAHEITSGIFTETPKYLVMADIEGFKPSTKHLSQEIASIFKLGGASDIMVAEDPEQNDAIWSNWLALKEKLNSDSSISTIDIMVGQSKLNEALKGLEAIVGNLNLCTSLIVHAPNGNILLVPSESSLSDIDETLRKINELAMGLGGSISGSPGQRLRCQSNNENEMWEDMAGIITSIREQFDPKGTLIPGESLIGI